MSFYQRYLGYRDFPFAQYLDAVTESQAVAALSKERLKAEDLLTLLSPRAEQFIEAMAQKAHSLTMNQFGSVIFLFTPMYLSNFCTNHCVYCGFNVRNKIGRRRLSFDEVEKEAAKIAETGLKHILILTGEAKKRLALNTSKDALKFSKHTSLLLPSKSTPLRPMNMGS